MEDTGIRVKELCRYLIKSMIGEPLTRAVVTDLGIEGDRRFGLVDLETGLVLTARRVPELLFAAPAGHGPGGGVVRVRLPDGRVTDDNAVLSEWLGRQVELRQAEPMERGRYEIAEDDDRPDGDWVRWEGPEGVFHDSTRTRVSIVSQEAIVGWDVRRFRANVVVAGGDERALVGHRVCIGTCRLDVVKKIDRCVIVTRPQPGLDRDKAVLTTVHRTRGGDMGVGAVVNASGTIDVGDPIYVLP